MLFAKPIIFVCLLTGILVGCAPPATATPAPSATAPIPTSTSPPPTQTASTETPIPVIPGVQVDIPITTETFTGVFPATVTGSGGNIGIILTNTETNQPMLWLPLVDALKGNENLRMVTFSYRDVHSTSAVDTRAVFDYLRAEGVDKIICMGSYYGAGACAALRAEPEIAAMVFFPSPIIPIIEEDFPKLFLTGDTDQSGYVGPLQRAYDQAAEPKIFKSYASGRHGPTLFTDPEVGSQVLADIVAFINGIVRDQ
jgi:hypothetical protein